MRRWIGALIPALLLLAGSVPAASAAGSRLFDATLSLTGNCKTSSIDPVPDPGCPGGVHPSAAFADPQSVATDKYGDIYVASDESTSSETKGRVDIFDSEGFFLFELGLTSEVHGIAVDSEGNLYVHEPLDNVTDRRHLIVRYAPSVYQPASGQIAYEDPPSAAIEGGFAGSRQMTLDRENDHLLIHTGSEVLEFASAAEGNGLIDSTLGAGTLRESSSGLAVDAAHGLVYATGITEEGGERRVTIWAFELEPPHNVLGQCDGSTIPAEKWGADPTLAVDEETGNLFVYDTDGTNQVYELAPDCELLATISHSFQTLLAPDPAFDNSPTSPNHGYLFVPSHPTGTGHSFAFAPPSELCPPEVESASASEVGEHEAELEAKIVPCDPAAHYAFEYTTEASFATEGFAGALKGPAGEIQSGSTSVRVAGQVGNLAAGTAYRFRIVAENACELPEGCSSEGEGHFATYPEPQPQGSCPNGALRTGPSALLPDCRAYELVTPPNTNGRAATGIGTLGPNFATRQASPSGERVSFLTEGGALPGTEGTGSYGGDKYLATRGEEGWSTALSGPTGAESPAPTPGGNSSDQGYSFWLTAETGPLAIGGESTSYVRYPDGHSALVGRGSIGSDPRAQGRFVSENGSHIVFVSGEGVRLEPSSPPAGTKAIYDRTADEVTHVVSLLPGNLTPGAGQAPLYLGSSFDGRGIAFSIEGTIYLRLDDARTLQVSEGGEFAGLAGGGARAFYLKGGDVFAYDAATERTIRFTESGDATVVNVASGGTAVYFVSPSLLAGPNPRGASPQPGGENLYRSKEGELSFVGTVAARDVEGEFTFTYRTDGLGLWLRVADASAGEGNAGSYALDPSRTTPAGGVFLFESRADLSGYDPEGHPEIYRYSVGENSLNCLSCNPTGLPATGEASLQSETQVKPVTAPLSGFAYLRNLRDDGRRAFFQSTEALVPSDTDGLQDVYQWEADEVGGCHRSGGCLDLISSGHSAQPDYLFGISDSGDDVFFVSSDLLVHADNEATPSVYDAKVGGGFAEPAEGEECLGETCRPGLSTAPALATPGITPNRGSGNLPKRCPKGKRRAHRHHRVVCRKRKHHRKHRRHHRHRKAATKRKGAGK